MFDRACTCCGVVSDWAASTRTRLPSAVVMVEGLFHTLRSRTASAKELEAAVVGLSRPLFFGVLVIVLAEK